MVGGIEWYGMEHILNIGDTLLISPRSWWYFIKYGGTILENGGMYEKDGCTDEDALVQEWSLKMESLRF